MSQATVTAYSGPGRLSTAAVITNVTGIQFDCVREVLFVETSVQPSPKQFELTGSNTITLTASAGNYTLTIS